jgi:hypothetical protein
VVETPVPSTLITSFSPSPSPFPISVAFPTEPIRYNKVYLALVAPALTAEPKPNQYKALTRSVAEYFTASIKALKEFDTELEEIVLTNEFNLFEEGVPDKRFNILMNFDLSATYSDDAINIPDEESLFSAVRDFGITTELIVDVVRRLSPFEAVEEIVFRISDLDAPP